MIKSDNNLHLVILGSNGLADEFSTKLKVTITSCLYIIYYLWLITLLMININYLDAMW